MPVQEISRKEWSTFCDSFTQQYQGWLVSLEVIGNDLGVIARYLPLEDIRVDRQDGNGEVICIMVGKIPDKFLSHIIMTPSRMKLEQTEQGTHQALEIGSATGTATILRLQPATFPELIEGVEALDL